jgi:hydrogenase nickel incorporation protein HypA/HybF
MHELSVTESILKIALQYGERAKAQRVTDLYLVIGQLSSIVDDSVQFYWDIISQHTIAEGAKLHFQRVPIKMACLTCHHLYSPESDDFACPNCGSTSVEVIAGGEFFLESMSVEEAADLIPEHWVEAQP